MQGRIIKGIAGFYYVYDVVESVIYECKAKGIFRKEKIKPLVGDLVEYEILDAEEKTGNIIRILPRKNELIRPAVANIDQALVVFAVKKPDPHFNLLDRFLVMMERLAQSRVAVFGVGGVGGYAVEALVRSGVGAIDIIDDDKVCLTNLNRQIIATRKTVGRYKVDVMEERIHDINPECKVTTYKCFYLPETKDDFDFSKYSYVIDAVDTVTAKLQLVMEAQEKQVPVISSMGAGNKLNPAMFEVADIYKTSVCPLAKVMRRELKKRGVKKLKVVYSKEQPIRPVEDMSISCRNHCICPPGAEHKCTERRAIPGSTAFVPSVVGLIIASEVIKDLVK